jgi:alanine racemase
MMKADAYGHGADIVADALCNFSDGPNDGPAMDALAVASIDEAAVLPDVRLPVIVFRAVENAFVGRQRAKLEEAVRCGWVLTLSSLAGAEDLARIALTCGQRASVQVMIDTGMTRCGICPRHLPELLRKIESRPSLRLVGLCTHFSNSEEADSELTRQQLQAFREATDAHAIALRGKVLRHAANSGAIFFAPDSQFDMVRPGLSLYGIDPLCRPDMSRPLRPALKWTAPLIGIRPVRKATGVGYGQTWVAPQDTHIGLIPIGYADGYPRCFSNRAVVLAGGKPAPVVGRVSMDLTTVDLGPTPQAQVGDEVTLLDSDPLSPVSVYELARWAQTIPYEIFCGIGPRVQRVAISPEDRSPALSPLPPGEGRVRAD